MVKLWMITQALVWRPYLEEYLWETFPREGNGNPLQYSWLENPTDRGDWQAAVCGVTKSRTGLSGWAQQWETLGCYCHSLGETKCYLWMQRRGQKCETESRSVVSYSLRPRGLYSPWNSPGHNTGVGSLSLLQGIFPTQGSNPGLSHCRRILYQLNYRGSPNSIWLIQHSRP